MEAVSLFSARSCKLARVRWLLQPCGVYCTTRSCVLRLQVVVLGLGALRSSGGDDNTTRATVQVLYAVKPRKGGRWRTWVPKPLLHRKPSRTFTSTTIKKGMSCPA